MEQHFWQEKWDSNDIAFHQQEAHPLLVKYFSSLGLDKGARVFVPLCGKSSDMLNLKAQGHKVVGLELSQVAAQSFFSENNLDASISETGDYKKFQSTGIEIFCGDIFLATSELLGNITAVFDRAALIALPPEMRRRYVEHMQLLLPSGSLILLITLEYEQGMINPPPFAVVQDEVKTLYGSWCDIELLEKASAEVKGKPCHELAYRLNVL